MHKRTEIKVNEVSFAVDRSYRGGWNTELACERKNNYALGRAVKVGKDYPCSGDDVGKLPCL